MPAIPAITVQQLKKMREDKQPHVLVDVREPDEYELCRIEGAKLIPLSELPKRVGELPKSGEIIVHCHHGGRSARAVEFLLQQGLAGAKNLAGGIDAWSAQIDSSVPRY